MLLTYKLLLFNIWVQYAVYLNITRIKRTNANVVIIFIFILLLLLLLHLHISSLTRRAQADVHSVRSRICGACRDVVGAFYHCQ